MAGLYAAPPYTVTVDDESYSFGGGTYRGVSITPVIFRWNFLTKSGAHSAVVSGCGRSDLYHAQVSAERVGDARRAGRDVRVELFAAGRRGDSVFTRSRRSIDIGVNGEHISSASLGDKNPGVNSSIQVQVGYTFWR